MLIVEDGTGVADAEAYISVTDARTYATKMGHLPEVVDALDADLEAALRRGAQFIDFLDIEEDPKTSTQGLYAPLQWSGLPVQFQQANVEAAGLFLRGFDPFDRVKSEVAAGVIRSESKTLGPISKSTTYETGSGAMAITNYERYNIVMALLRPWARAGRGRELERA